MLISVIRKVRLNEEITGARVRLINEVGENQGIMSLGDAQQSAEDKELDLVELAPDSDPPVCRIMDYGKFRFAQVKKAHQAKKNQRRIQVKEIKFRPGTEKADYQTKLRNLIRFLTDGDKTKVTIRFRGREILHQHRGLELLDRIKEDLKDFSDLEQGPKSEGRQMMMVLAPKKKLVQKNAQNQN